MLFGVYLGLYAWNSRTGTLDRLSENTGLEFTGWVLKPGRVLMDNMSSFWDNYLNLVNVRTENDRLQEEVRTLTIQVQQSREALAELARLQKLLELDVPKDWSRSAVRVLAGRIGSFAVFDSLIIDRGYLSGATVGTALATSDGIVGSVFRSAPSTALILLLTDPSSRIAVMTAEGRVAGLLEGNGARQLLSLKYIPLKAEIAEGDLLITSGRDGVFPKGVPVGRVASIHAQDVNELEFTSRSDASRLFLQVLVQPVVDVANLEELLLLHKPVQIDKTDIETLQKYLYPALPFVNREGTLAGSLLEKHPVPVPVIPVAPATSAKPARR